MKDAKRIADDQIYMSEDRFDKPKEMFKYIYSLIGADRLSTAKTMLDVGCATGEFIFYMNSVAPHLSCVGVDVSQSLINRAREVQPSFEFICDDASSLTSLNSKKYDLVFSIGVLQIFDDIESPLLNLVEHVSTDGLLIIAGSFNEHSIDVLMTYRNGGDFESIWETGWNLFSKKTYEEYLSKMEGNLSWEWHDFRMPFSLPKRSDLMRSWTISTEENPNQLINGAAQLLDTKVLVIKRGVM